MVLVVILIVIINACAYAAGFGMYAYYASKGCDPLSSGEISSPNQVEIEFTSNDNIAQCKNYVSGVVLILYC